jgi:periplasmic divalent cation tolerance protein
MIGWTTTASREEAEGLGRGLVEAGLVACAQVDGPITSIYRWEGAVETASEFRLTLKFVGSRQAEVGSWLLAHHSYQTPQWVCVSVDVASKNYLNWVMQTSS